MKSSIYQGTRIFTKLRALRRREGLSAAMRRVCYRTAQRVVTLDVTRLMRLDAKSLQMPRHDPAITYRLLDACEVDDLAQDPSNGLEGSLSQRIRSGRDLCCGAFADNRLAGFCWFAAGSIEAEHNRGDGPATGTALSFPDDAMFVYNGFTRAEYRGRKIYPACIGRGFLEVMPLGITRLLISADWTNAAALRACRSLGFAEIGTLCRFACRTTSFSVYPRTFGLLGIRVDRHAQVWDRSSIAPHECRLADFAATC